MNKVGIIYWSGTGNTEMMAKGISEGVKTVGGEAELITADSFDSGKLDNYQAFAFGCPSMGDEELEDSEFLPMWEEVLPNLSGKKVALFGSYGWGDGEWMRLWEEECQNNGVDLVCDFLIINYTPTDDGMAECKTMGESLAKA